MTHSKTVLMMAGGTGGHVFPALAIAEALQKEGYTIIWLGTTQGLEAQIVPDHRIHMETIPIQGLRKKGLARKLLMPFMLLKATWQCRKIIKKHHISLAIGMGGYVSGPGAFAAKLTKIPLFIHEQNAKAGLTNRILAPFAKRVFCAFDHTFAQDKKPIVTGNPIRSTLLKAKPSENITQKGPLKLLVIGGSLGAMLLNIVIPEAIAKLPKAKRPKIWHQCGKKTHYIAEKAYAKCDVDVKIAPFITDMNEAYSWADIVICRAGALTVSEVAQVGAAAIFAPLWHAVDNHQYHNAQTLASHKAALCIEQPEFTAENIANLLLDFDANREKLERMKAIAKTFATPDATKTIVNYCKEELI